MEKFQRLCKKHNLRITPQRTAIYKMLIATNSHPCADQVHKALREEFPNISLDTVNRTLLTFARAGMIDEVEGHGDPRRFDPNLEEHHHFYCIECHTIFDFKDTALDEIPISPELEKRFSITGKRVCLTGLCDICRK